MKLLLDQGLPHSAATMLSEKGIDTIHVMEIGYAQAEDQDILLKAGEEGRVIVTIDSDFHALVALTGETFPSVIRLRMQGLTAQGLTDLLASVLDQCREYLEQGALVTVQSDKVRIRKLPIAPKSRSI
jgi:predicted nuclease of predicted toxin-antitoxin system